MTTTSVSELMDARDDALKAEMHTDIANVVFTIERRITSSTYWILSVRWGVSESLPVF